MVAGDGRRPAAIRTGPGEQGTPARPRRVKDLAERDGLDEVILRVERVDG